MIPGGPCPPYLLPVGNELMLTQSSRKTVAVFGAYDPAEGSVPYQLALEVGRELGQLGFDVANGGYGGTMEACARGAKEAGAGTVAVTCSIWKSPANRFMDRCIQTHTIQQRVLALIEIGEGGFVALPGATGTLLELATAWEMVAKRMIARRPVVCVGSFWRPLVEMMSAARSQCADCIALIESPRELGRHMVPSRQLNAAPPAVQ